jgi:hypothetical protein
VLDFRVFEGQAIGQKGLAELVKAVEELTIERKKWTDGAKGLNINRVKALVRGL